MSIVVPVYNEVSTIREILDRTCAASDAAGRDDEILVVNDGSTDGTDEILSGLTKWPNLRVLTHERNRGKGTAIRTALNVAKREYLIVQDADLEYDPGDMSRMIEVVNDTGADVVFGSRVLGVQADLSEERRNIYAAGVSVLNRLVAALYGVRLTDEATCYKLFRTCDLRRMELSCQRFEFCPEVTAKATRLGLVIREIPISYHPRSVSEGKKIRFYDAVEAAWTLWRYRCWQPENASSVPNAVNEVNGSKVAKGGSQEQKDTHSQ